MTVLLALLRCRYHTMPVISDNEHVLIEKGHSTLHHTDQILLLKATVLLYITVDHGLMQYNPIDPHGGRTNHRHTHITSIIASDSHPPDQQ